MWRNLRSSKKFWKSARSFGNAANPNRKANELENCNLLCEALFDQFSFRTVYSLKDLSSQNAKINKKGQHMTWRSKFERFITKFSCPPFCLPFLFSHLIQKQENKNDLFFTTRWRCNIFGRKFTLRAEEPLGAYSYRTSSRSGRIPSRWLGRKIFFCPISDEV